MQGCGHSHFCTRGDGRSNEQNIFSREVLTDGGMLQFEPKYLRCTSMGADELLPIAVFRRYQDTVGNPLKMLWFKSTSLHILTSVLKVFMPLSLMPTLHMHKIHQDFFIIKSTHHHPHVMRMTWTWLNIGHANPVHTQEHIFGLMFLPLVLRRVGVRRVPGVLLSQKNKSSHSHPFVGYHIGSAPSTILSARHFLRTYSRNI